MSGQRQRINRAVREIPGGSLVLEHLNLWHKIRQRKEQDGTEEEIRLAVLAEEHLHQIRKAMVDGLGDK